LKEDNQLLIWYKQNLEKSHLKKEKTSLYIITQYFIFDFFRKRKKKKSNLNNIRKVIKLWKVSGLLF
jgi:hypothetical protein